MGEAAESAVKERTKVQLQRRTCCSEISKINQVESKSHKVNSRPLRHRGWSLQCILRQYCDDIEKHWGKSPKFVPAIYSVELKHGAWA